MNSSFFNCSLIFVFIPVFIFILCFSAIFPLTIEEDNSNSIFLSNIDYNSSMLWPTPDYTTISSYFGYRVKPTSGASTYHSGIDIAAPSGTDVVAVFSGKVIYTGFSGAGGYTITISNNEFTASYCHLSPLFLVNAGDYVYSGSIIGSVGSKNVYGVPNNPYHDLNGNPTNRCYYWPTFAFDNKKRRQSRQSFRLYIIIFVIVAMMCATFAAFITTSLSPI